MPAAYCHTRWSQGKMFGKPHRSPEWECKCGYYSLKPTSLIRPPDWPKGSWSVKAMIDFGVVGWVDTWGEVIETEFGYRSEHVKVNSFILFDMEWCEQWYQRERGISMKLWTEEEWHRRMAEAQFGYENRVGMFADRFGVPVVMYG